MSFHSVRRPVLAAGGLLFAVVVAAGAVLVRAQAEPLPSAPAAARRWIDSALEDLARGRTEAAAGKLRLARWTAPADPEATILLAWVHAAREEWQEARSLLGAVDVESLPPSWRAAALGVVGMAHQALGEAARAAQAYGQLLESDPTAALAHEGLGKLAMDAASDSRTAAELRSSWPAGAGAAAPDSPDAWRKLAEDELRAALKQAPDRMQLYVSLARSLMDSQRWEEAGAVLKEALRVNYRVPALHYLLGELYERQGNEAAAIGAYRRALEIDPTYRPASERLERLRRAAP
ncbi:MAG: tetratricopeptide repeat protein [Bacillota bacterium]